MKTIRNNIHETNSSSSHALVISTLSDRYLLTNPKKFKFRVMGFSFGRDHGVYTDAPHKFSYIFQFLLDRIEMPKLDEDHDENSLEYQTSKINQKNQFDKFKLLLELISDQLASKTKIKLDFSELEVYSDGELHCTGYETGSYFDYSEDGTGINSQMDDYFKISDAEKIINKMMRSKKAPNIFEYSKKNGEVQLTWEGKTLVECFSSMLEFAFDENSIILCSDESMSDELMMEKEVCDYVAKNRGHCIIAWLF